MARTFQAIDEDQTIVPGPGSDRTGKPADPAAAAATAEQQRAAMAAFKLLLATLSQKTIVALSNLVTAAAIFSAWWLWNGVLPEPSNNQLIGVTLYAGFILAVEFLRRR